MSGPILVAASTVAKAETSIAALRHCGVSAERIVRLLPADAGDARRLAARAGGLVLTGGPDVDPSRYGQQRLPGTNLSIQPDRDTLDFALATGAREGGVPVWGICRGMQVLNVFLGGTLWQDVPSQLAGTLLHDLDHPADALVHVIRASGPSSRSREILDREPAFVNSRHHQAVRELAPGLVRAGVAPDGVLEAVELDDPEWWVRAVQWHPENLVAMAQQRALWQEFLAAVDALDGHGAALSAAAGAGRR